MMRSTNESELRQVIAQGSYVRPIILQEKLEWLPAGALDRIKTFNKENKAAGKPGRLYFVKAITPTTTGNDRTYTEDELKRFARTLIGKQADIDHHEHKQDTTVVDAEYNDKTKAVELVVYSADKEINGLYDQGKIHGASIEGDPRESTPGPEGTVIVHGAIGTGIAFVSTAETPADSHTAVELLETLKSRSAMNEASLSSAASSPPGTPNSGGVPDPKDAGPDPDQVDDNAMMSCVIRNVRDGMPVADAVTKCTQELKESVWDAAYINDLPDDAFAVIDAGGKKDADGKTVPRSLRHLPYKDKDGKPDQPHVANALARLSQTKLAPDQRKEALGKICGAAHELGVTSPACEILAVQETVDKLSKGFEETNKTIVTKMEVDMKPLQEELKKISEQLSPENLTRTVLSKAKELKLTGSVKETAGSAEPPIEEKIANLSPAERAALFHKKLRDTPLGDLAPKNKTGKMA